MATFVPRNYDGVASSQAPANAPTYSPVSQAAPSVADQRIQWLQNRAAAIREQRAQQATAQQQQQQQLSGITPGEYQALGGFDRYTQQNPGTISGPDDMQMREMNPFEQGIAYAGNNLSDIVSSYSGFDPEKGFTLENMAAFVASLPGQMASGMLQAPANFASGITGNQYLDNPYTEQLEVDADKGLITTDTLDGAQKAASIVNGIINTGLTGASGQALRSITPLFRTVGQAGREILRNAPKAAQIGFSMGTATAEEAGEEFVQSYLDDITFDHVDENSLSRAVEGAKWGALGGGIMSGFGHGAAYIHGKIKGDDPTTSAENLKDGGHGALRPEIHDDSQEYQLVRDNAGNWEYMPNQQKWLKEQRLNSFQENTPGSVVVKHAKTRTGNWNLDDIAMSDEDIIRMYNGTTAEGQADIINAFGSTKEEFDAALYNRTFDGVVYDDAGKALTALLMARTNERGARVALMRNPDTKNGGFFVNLKEITHGGDLQAHAAVYTLFGADVDGDTSVVYFNADKANVAGYASELLMHPEGRQNINDLYLGYRTDLKRKEVRKAVKDALAPFSASDSTIDFHTDNIVKAMKRDPDDNVGMASALNKLYESAYMASKKTNNGSASRHMARTVVNSALNGISATEVEIYKQTLAPRANQVLKQEFSRTSKGVDSLDGIAAFLNEVDRSGAVGSDTMPVDVWESIGFLVYNITTKGNIIFRQYGQAGFTAKSVNAYLESVGKASRLLSDGDVVGALIRSSFRMISEGISPAKATEGIFNSYVISKTLGEWTDNRKIRNSADVDAFLSLFVENYNKGVEMYNDAQKMLDSQGFGVPFGVTLKDTLSDASDPALARQLNKVFESTPIGSIFDTSFLPSGVDETTTFSQFIEPLARKGDVRSFIEVWGATDDTKVQGFLNRLVSGYKSDKKVSSKKAQDIIVNTNYGEGDYNLVERYEKGLIDEQDIRRFQAACDALCLVMDPEIAFDAGIRGIDILGTRVGKMLFGKDRNARLNAFVGASLDTEFRPLIKALKEGGENIESAVFQILDEKAEINDIKKAIAAQIMNSPDHESKLLNALTTLDISWETKLDNWAELGDVGDIVSATDDLFFDCIMTETSDFDISGMAVRIKKAETQVSNMYKLLYTDQRADLDELLVEINNHPGVSLKDFVFHCAKIARTSYNVDILGAKVYAAAVLVNAQMEKGTNEHAGTLSYQTLEMMVNGAMMPYLNQITGEVHGVMSMDSFATNRNLWLTLFQDTKREYALYDPATGQYGKISFDIIMKNVDPTWVPGQEANDKHIELLLKKYPQLVDILTDARPQGVINGGNVNVVQGKNRKLHGAFERYCNEKTGLWFNDKDTKISAEMERRLEQISNILLNWNDYTGYLIRAVGTDSETLSSPKEFNDKITAMHKKFVRGIFKITLENKDGANIKKITNSYLSDLVHTAMRDLQDNVDAVVDSMQNDIEDSQAVVNQLFVVKSSNDFSKAAWNVASILDDYGYDVASDIAAQIGDSPLPAVDDVDAVVDSYEDLFDERREEIEEYYEKIESLLWFMHGNLEELTGTFSINGKEIFDGVEPAIIDHIRSRIIAPVTDDQIRSTKDYKDVIADVKRSLIEDNMKAQGLIAPSDIIPGGIFTEADFSGSIDDGKVESLISKAMGILHEIEDAEPEPDTRKRFENAYSEYKESGSNSDFLKLMKYYNSQVFVHLVQKAKSFGDSDINVNIVNDLNDTVDSFNSLLDEIRLLPDFLDYDSITGFKTEMEGKDFELPKMNFSSTRNQAIVSSLQMVERGSMASTKVGVNGSATKMLTGFGFLNPYENKRAISRSNMTAGEISDMVKRDRKKRDRLRKGDSLKQKKEAFRIPDWENVKCTLVMEDRELRSSDIMSIGQLMKKIRKGKIDPNTPVRFFHPDDNAHGIEDLNTEYREEWTVRKYSTLGSILGLLQDDAQEGMVLKLKKTFASKTKWIVDKREVGDPNAVKLSADAFSTLDSAFSNMKRALVNTRHDFAYDLLCEFNKNHSAADLDYNAALVLAQAITPAFKLTFSDGSEVFFDVGHLFTSQEDFNAAWLNVVGNKQVTGMTLKFATPEEISSKIMRKVSQIDDSDLGSIDYVRNIAADAVYEWDGVEADSLSVERIMARVNPVGFSFDSGIVGENVATPQQMMLNALFHSSYGTVPTRGRSYKPVSRMNETDLGKSRLKAKVNKGAEGTKFKIVQTFIPGRWDSDTSSKGKIYRDNQTLIKVVNAHDDLAAATVWDISVLKDAEDWAVEYGNMLLIPEDVQKQREYSRTAIIDGWIDKDKRRWVIVNPREDSRYRAHPAGVTQSPRVHYHRDNIFFTYIDNFVDGIPGMTSNGIFSLGDAEIIGWNRAGEITRRVGKNSIVNASFYLGKSNGNFRILDREAVLEKFGNSNANGFKHLDYRSCSHQNKDIIKQSISSYVDLLRDASEIKDGVIKGGVRKGEVIAIISDGISYAPIFLPDSAARETEYTGIDLEGAQLQLYWTGRTTVGGEYNDRAKMALSGEAFKGELSMASSSQVAPTIWLPDGKKAEIQMAVSGDTQKSRAYGKDKLFLIEDLWYACKYYGREFGFSYMYRRNDEGKWVITDRIESEAKKIYGENAVTSDGRYLYKMHLNDFRNGTGDLWKRFRLGEAKFFDESGPDSEKNKKRNRTVRKILNVCDRYSIDPQDIFDFAHARSNDSNTVTDVLFHLVFQNLTRDEILLFYSGMDGRICASGIDDTSTDACKPNDSTQPMFDRFGNMKTTVTTFVKDENDKTGKKTKKIETVVYAPIRVGSMNSIGDESVTRSAGYDASYPYQHLYRRADDFGYLPSEIKTMVNYARYLTLDSSFNGNNMKIRLRNAARRAKENHPGVDDDTIMARIAAKYPHDSLPEIEHKRDVNSIMRSRLKPRRVVDGDQVIENPWEHDLVKHAMSRLRDTVRFNVFPPHHIIEYTSKRVDGHSNLKNGNNDVPVTSFAKSIERIAHNIKEYGMPVANDKQTGLTLDDRYAITRLTPEEIDIWWNYCEDIKTYWNNDKQKFIDAVKEMSDKSLNQIEQLGATNPSKARALLKEYEADYNLWGDWNMGASPYTYGNKYIFDQVYADNVLANALRQSTGDFDIDLFNEMCERSRSLQGAIKDRINNINRIKTVTLNVENSNVVAYMKTTDDKVYRKILDNATQLSRFMAMLNPGVTIGNMMDRVSHQGIMCGSLWLGRNLHLGPYATKRNVNQEAVKLAVENLVEIYTAHRMAELNGEELEFLSSLKSLEQVREWYNERKKKMTPYQRAVDRMYGVASGGNKFIKTQIANFINRFAMFVDEQGQDFWFEDAGNGMSNLENYLRNNPIGWYTYIFGAGNNSPSLTEALQAMNSAKMGDMAQRNVLTAILANAVKDRPLPQFLVTTMVCRFPNYALNIAGRMLNWVMPMSSINYVFTNTIADMATKRTAEKGGVDPHYEQYQIHRSLREAMLVDITHLGVTAVSGILVMMAGGIEPPEDERKWGNLDEWTVCGLRVGEAWWIEDILGMALPSAAFTKSMMMGKPRFDILFNGASQVMYNNPIIKVADVVGFLADPEGHIMTNYEEDYERFQNAKGGPPAFADWLQATSTSLGLNWMSQFILPSMVKEWYSSAQPYEVSYKKVYEENQYGGLTEEGAAREAVMDTTYQDAMLRRLTRRNPVLGWLADMVIHPNTGYLSGEMPRTRWIDDIQLAQAEQWSIEGMEPKEAEAKLLEIVAVMQSYDDMNELRQTGFYLDYTTKAALSSLCWDTVNELDQWYNGLQADGYFDYYAWGDGDFSEGQEAVGQIKQYYQSCRNYWSDFYYKKVRSTALSEPMVTYNRYNTSYAVDTEGNVYATGMRPQGILPFISAPGQIGNPEGTAGWGNDWASISAVTGQPMDQRALIPVAQGTEDWPSLEDWKDPDSKNGYSKLYESWNSNTAPGDSEENAGNDGVGKLTGLPTGGTSTRKATTGGGGSYGGGRGYSGGSGGGDYYPSIRVNVSTPNISTPYVMDRVARRRPQFDYLRPSFETKGSREAYRREDI